MFSDFPSLHPLAIHFPIVLILMAAIFQVFVVWKPHWQEIRWATLLVMGGAFFSALAASTLFHAMIAPDAPKAAMAAFEEHEKYAQLTLWMSGITLLLKSIGVLFKIDRRLYEVIVLIAAIIAAVFLSITGHHGAKLTHIEGVGPKGNYLMKDHAGHDEKDMKGMGMPDKGSVQMNDSMPGMKNMPGMDTIKNVKGMDDMKGMDNKKDMKNMKGMDNMKNMKNMKGVKNMKDTKNMKGMENMKDTKNMKGMDNMKDMKDMDTMKNMKEMDNMKDMKGMNMKGNAMDSLRFPDNNPARKISKKPVKQ
ncbi:DUF2231 domain-containing protein [Pedobacter nutrimenti]|uniref:Putative membrane protein n=1 Tax=Pedobacter nutrimenti TaxID=1241337 RepID=A0A318UGN0_9SPHI|nr:DUF2231 domain-containing protein [Pedobacter nutrimenti]PYF74650.1 putative membrane protein [Pedobacter nutrimenti]